MEQSSTLTAQRCSIDPDLIGKGFYSPAEAARLARIPRRLLADWRRAGIIFPTIEVQINDEPVEQGYTFASLIYLRLLRMLRENKIPLLGSIKALRALEYRFGPPGEGWANARIFVYRREIVGFQPDEWQFTSVSRGNQKIADSLFGDEFAALKDRPDSLLVPKEFQPFVALDPTVRDGAPTVIGTTITTGVLHRLLQRLHKLEEVHASYPDIALSQIAGAIRYEEFLDAAAA